MTPENRDYIISLIAEATTIDDIIETFDHGCDCAHCIAVDEYLTWVNIGEYTNDFDDRRIIEYPPKRLRKDFDSMYFDYIPRLWRQYRRDTMSTPDFYSMNDALITYESDRRAGVRALKNILGPAFYFKSSGARPLRPMAEYLFVQ
jgi:hypothetical protein